MTLSHLIPTLLISTVFTATALAHPVRSPADDTLTPAFDILDAHATTDGRLVTFMMELNSLAGSVKPEAVGQLTGSQVDAYVWPTSLDPSTVGFDTGSGRLALAITAHPDFDDTPLFDENNDGDPANDGADWHSHWVVLVPEDACGAGLKVRDVSPGQDLLPATAPGLPIALDSPGMSPVLQGRTARITVPVSEAEHQSFDAVTARLEVHPDGAQPLLCVTGVYDIGSGDLSLPGVIMGETE